MEIYKITNTVTKKCYIGKTTIGYLKRFANHKYHARNKVNRRLYNSMNFHGIEVFTIECIKICTTIEELNIEEIQANILYTYRH